MPKALGFEADRELLEQALINLLKNALQAAERCSGWCCRGGEVEEEELNRRKRGSPQKAILRISASFRG